MSSINGKLGLKAAGARARLNTLSGVPCPACGCSHVVSFVTFSRLRWACGICSHGWDPSPADVTTYNNRVRERDRIEVR